MRVFRFEKRTTNEYAKGSKANVSTLLTNYQPTQLDSFHVSALANSARLNKSRLGSTDSTTYQPPNNNKSQGVEGGELFVVVGGDGVVVLAGLLCVACDQASTSARTLEDSAHLSCRRAFPSVATPESRGSTDVHCEWDDVNIRYCYWERIVLLVLVLYYTTVLAACVP